MGAPQLYSFGYWMDEGPTVFLLFKNPTGWVYIMGESMVLKGMTQVVKIHWKIICLSERVRKSERDSGEKNLCGVRRYRGKDDHDGC